MLPSAVAKLLPTPQVADADGGHASRSGDRSGELLLPGVAVRLLPTPNAGDAKQGYVSAEDHAARAARKAEQGINLQNDLPQVVTTTKQWGDYADAINRWAHVLGRPAPTPTETSPKGKPRLSPRFEEWMMGLPDGWITDTPDVTWQEAVRMCGNGVVPQQAEAAVRWLLTLDHLAREAS